MPTPRSPTIRGGGAGRDVDDGHPRERTGDSDLTARFDALPAHHDGATAFTFELAFSEAAVSSWRTVAGGLLDVTGGSVTGARRTNPSGPNRSLRWTVTVTPSGNGDVSITLPVRACTDANAACVNGRPLAREVSATVPVKPFTGRFTNVPAEHVGSETFTLEFHLSEAPRGMSWESVRDHLFDVSGGTIDNARRTGPVHNRGWQLTVVPTGDAEISLTLKGTTSCDDSHAVCTSDGRRLAGGATTTIQGPAALSVADAEVQEAEGATLDFAVTLSRTRPSATTVDYATSDGTAVAGSDYTSTSGTLTFAVGETSKTVSVAVLDDAHDEGTETLTFTLSNPSGARLDDAEATGTITNTDPMPGAWLARFGRTVGSQVVGALGARLDNTPSSHFTVGGVSLGGATSSLEAEPLTPRDWMAEQLAHGPDAYLPEERTLTGQDLLLGSSFHLVSQDDGGRRGPLLSAWGRVDHRRLPERGGRRANGRRRDHRVSGLRRRVEVPAGGCAGVSQRGQGRLQSGGKQRHHGEHAEWGVPVCTHAAGWWGIGVGRCGCRQRRPASFLAGRGDRHRPGVAVGSAWGEGIVVGGRRRGRVVEVGRLVGAHGE